MVITALLLLSAAVSPQSGAATGGPDTLRRADAQLNAQYAATMRQMKANDAANAPDAQQGPSYQQALRTAQEAWIKFRDANCLSVGYEYRGGSAERLSRGTCLVDMTKTRTAELRQIARGAQPD